MHSVQHLPVSSELAWTCSGQHVDSPRMMTVCANGIERALENGRLMFHQQAVSTCLFPQHPLETCFCYPQPLPPSLHQPSAVCSRHRHANIVTVVNAVSMVTAADAASVVNVTNVVNVANATNVVCGL